jgi:hypothetical protein
MADPAPPGLPFLQRPLGVPDPPGSEKPGWVLGLRKDDLRDRDTFEGKRMDERRHMCVLSTWEERGRRLTRKQHQGGCAGLLQGPERDAPPGREDVDSAEGAHPRECA